MPLKHPHAIIYVVESAFGKIKKSIDIPKRFTNLLTVYSDELIVKPVIGERLIESCF